MLDNSIGPPDVKRLPEESEAAYRMFLAYLMMPAGKRSIRELAKQQGLKSGATSRMFLWSREHQWQDRCRLHDDALARQKLAAYDNVEINAAQEHAVEAAELRRGALQQLRNLLDAGDLRARDAIALWQQAVMIQRLSLGLSTSNQAAKADVRIEAVDKPPAESALWAAALEQGDAVQQAIAQAALTQLQLLAAGGSDVASDADSPNGDVDSMPDTLLGNASGSRALHDVPDWAQQDETAQDDAQNAQDMQDVVDA